MMLQRLHSASHSARFGASLDAAKKTVAGFKWMAGVCAVLCNMSVCALTEDRNQPVQVVADKAERNAKTGITVYSGSVQVDQGSLRINADTVTIKMEKDQVVLVTAIGRQAHYQQQITGPADQVKARGDQINYHVPEEKIMLDGNAFLEQKGSSIKGDHVEYEIRAEKVKARAGENGATNERVTVIIPPSKKDDAEPAGKAVPLVPTVRSTPAADGK